MFNKENNSIYLREFFGGKKCECYGTIPVTVKMMLFYKGELKFVSAISYFFSLYSSIVFQFCKNGLIRDDKGEKNPLF
jgi:hypothetical protein